MPSAHRRIWIATALSFLVCTLAGATERARIPGTTASLEPPAGFSPAEKFAGFQREDLGASIMVTEIPAPAADMMKGMTKENMATRGMTLLSSSSERVSGREALLLHAAQRVAENEFLKWLLVTGDETKSVMIVATFPKRAEGEVGAALRRAVLSASWSATATGDRFEGLDFRVTPTDKLKIAGRLSNVLILSETGGMASADPNGAVYFVGSSISEARIVDLPTFAEERAKQSAQIKELRTQSGREIEMGGLAAYELLGDAKDQKTGIPLRFYQVIAPLEEGYVIVQGLVGVERADELLAEFHSISQSFRAR